MQDILDEILSVSNSKNIRATYFEIATIMALKHFENSACEAVVLEVGLGGLEDSTNIVHPQLSIITSIQLDHTMILGDTLEKIAFQKAGIMKPGVPVVVGLDGPIDYLKVLMAQLYFCQLRTFSIYRGVILLRV